MEANTSTSLPSLRRNRNSNSSMIPRRLRSMWFRAAWTSSGKQNSGNLRPANSSVVYPSMNDSREFAYTVRRWVSKSHTPSFAASTMLWFGSAPRRNESSVCRRSVISMHTPTTRWALPRPLPATRPLLSTHRAVSSDKAIRYSTQKSDFCSTACESAAAKCSRSSGCTRFRSPSYVPANVPGTRS